MLRDVFYYGNKPNVHPREKFARDFDDAKSQATTVDFWIINEFCDYRDFDWDFDFEFLPDEDVWAEDHINVWPSRHQKDSGTWLCNTDNNEPLIIYRADVVPLVRKNIKSDNWVLLESIDEFKFDFSWHPDPTDPPYIYVWGNQWHSGMVMPTVEYHVPGATAKKYIEHAIAILLPRPENFDTFEKIENFDYSWVPNPTSPPFIYAWGNQWNIPQDKLSVQYIVDGATEFKYMTERTTRLSCIDNWIIPSDIESKSFDYSWEPSPAEPPYIYQFGTQWQKTGGPRYVVEGATEVKYIDRLKAKRISSDKNWTLPTNIDLTNFDFSWHPDDTSPPYIYVFPTQWALSGGPVYTVEGATETKYVEDMIAKAVPDKTNWEVPAFIDEESFDFSWHPYAQDEPYIYQFGTQWQKTGGPVFKTPGVHANSPIKYIDTRILKAKRLPSKKGFALLNNYAIEDFDYSWHPDATDEPYIYVFGNKQYPGEIMPTIEYAVPGAKQIKYVTDVVATLAPDMNSWEIPADVDVSTFDFSWKPNPKDPPYIYQFGTQWQKTGGPRYVIEGATEVKYISDLHAIALPKPNDENWHLPGNVKMAEFDYSWHPDDTEQPYTYQFGTQWQLTSGPKYVTPNSIGTKYIDPNILHAKAAADTSCWQVPTDIDAASFDFSWHPHPDDPDFIYQFGTQWQKTDGPRYIPDVDHSEMLLTKYIDTRILKAKKMPNMTNWVIPEGVNVSRFDFSWHPDANAPACVYQFGTITDPTDGPRYVVPGNDGEIVTLERVETETNELVCSQYFIETTLEDLVKKHPAELFWALNPDLDYSEFDFSWRPSIEQANYVHAFGSQDNINTQTYFVNSILYNKGFTEINYVEGKMEVKTKIDMFFVDKGNSESSKRFDELKRQFPTIQKTRYLNTWVDTINRCINRSSTNLCWILNSELDYTSFNFDYYPNAWQMKMIHVFGTQWSHWGTTFMINRETFAEDTKYIKTIEHLSNLNFVKDRRAKATNVLHDIVYIDHGNLAITPGTNVVKYEESYLKTFKNMLATLPNKKDHYIWVCSSVCDYSGFDFTYICDPFAREQLHVFPSDKQKFGDTFLVNVNKLRELIADTEKLEDIKINYNQHQRTKRLPAPTIITESDTHVSTIHTDFDWPYATFVTQDNKDIQVIDTEPLNLWSPETRTIQITSTGGTRIIVPKEAKDHVKRELYDYPYISTASRLAKSTPMDIVFLSNGEVGADENYEHLLRTTNGLANRVTRVDGVNGRVAAYHAAAEASNTPWMFTVFAKLKVNNKFDWNWQPDRLQIPKHYVFHAKNPVNGLTYGHQAMIAYNKKLTLANTGKGLDFTMDDEHEVVELLSGTANFNTDEWSTWRTAFREALKLRANTDDVSKNRLEFWLTVGSGKYSQYSIDGASDAVHYYEEVNGDFDKLKLSYEWEWLRALFNSKYR